MDAGAAGSTAPSGGTRRGMGRQPAELFEFSEFWVVWVRAGYDTNLAGAGCRAVWLGGGECGGGRAGYDIDARPRRLPTCVALGLRMYWSWLVRVFWGEFFLARTHARALRG